MLKWGFLIGANLSASMLAGTGYLREVGPSPLRFESAKKPSSFVVVLPPTDPALVVAAVTPPPAEPVVPTPDVATPLNPNTNVVISTSGEFYGPSVPTPLPPAEPAAPTLAVASPNVDPTVGGSAPVGPTSANDLLYLFRQAGSEKLMIPVTLDAAARDKSSFTPPQSTPSSRATYTSK